MSNRGWKWRKNLVHLSKSLKNDVGHSRGFKIQTLLGQKDILLTQIFSLKAFELSRVSKIQFTLLKEFCTQKITPLDIWSTLNKRPLLMLFRSYSRQQSGSSSFCPCKKPPSVYRIFLKRKSDDHLTNKMQGHILKAISVCSIVAAPIWK